MDEPRVTTFPIVWDEQQSTDQLVFAELTEEEKKLAEMSEELDICQSMENVNCSHEIPEASTEVPAAQEPVGSTEPLKAMEQSNETIDSNQCWVFLCIADNMSVCIFCKDFLTVDLFFIVLVDVLQSGQRKETTLHQWEYLF